MSPSTRVATPPQRSLRTSDRGIALIMVILVTSFLSALVLGVTLAVFMDRLASGNMTGSVAMLYAADAAVELAAHDLSQLPDWSDVLAGTVQGSFTDGARGGVRALPGGGAVDLTATTNQLNCAKPTTCTNAQMNAYSKERPWGANNPRWTLFAYGSIDSMVSLLRPPPCYIAIWIGDDSREQDANPLMDAAGNGDPGHGIVRVHAEAFGFAGARRAIEAELARVCEGALCPGIRVQSWRELGQAVP